MMKRRELVKELQRQTANYFKNRGFRVDKNEYILENRDEWRNNIILPEVADYIEKEKRRPKRLQGRRPEWYDHSATNRAL